MTAQITDFLKVGAENAISGKTLAAKLGLNERRVRELMEQLRRNGTIICNKQDGKGYFLPNGIEDIEQQFIQNRNRSMSILVQQKYLYAELKKSGKNVKWIGEVAE